MSGALAGIEPTTLGFGEHANSHWQKSTVVVVGQYSMPCEIQATSKKPVKRLILRFYTSFSANSGMTLGLYGASRQHQPSIKMPSV
jgi:hypothetical protein